MCLEDYPSGISVLCQGPGRRARFNVNNGRTRIERRAPFYISGDVRGRVRPWRRPPPKARIMCRIDKKYRVFAKIVFKC